MIHLAVNRHMLSNSTILITLFHLPSIGLILGIEDILHGHRLSKVIMRNLEVLVSDSFLDKTISITLEITIRTMVVVVGSF